MSTTDPPTTAAEPFSTVLPQMERGLLDLQLGEEIERVTDQVLLNQKQGTVTLKLTIKPEDNDEVDEVTLVAEIKANAPKPPRRASKFFRTRDRHLTRKFPNQLTDPALGGDQEDPR